MHGWRLIPIRTLEKEAGKLFDIRDYITEVLVPKNSGLSSSIQDLFVSSGGRGGRSSDKILRPKLTHTSVEGSAEATENILMSTPLKLVEKGTSKSSEFQNDDIIKACASVYCAGAVGTSARYKPDRSGASRTSGAERTTQGTHTSW